ncbi:MAG TPA: DUF3618 domain-containing protein [Verrucomicrobiae bacterium]
MKPRHSSNQNENQDSEEIMASIAETRAQMDNTLDELSERLQPRHILDDVIDWFRSHRSSSGGSSGEKRQKIKRVAGKAAGQVKEKASTAGRAAYSGLREHPIPALLIGAGISMLLVERRRHDNFEYDGEYDTGNETASGVEYSMGYGDLTEGAEAGAPESYALPQHYNEQGGSDSGGMGARLKEKGSQLKDKASHLKERAGERMQNLKQRTSEKTRALRERAGERGSQLKEKAYHGYASGREAFSRTSGEQPLAVGLGFLAVGLLAGMLLPSTRREDELVGPTRDRIVNRTKDAAEDAMQRGKQVAQRAVEVARQQAQEQGLTPEALKEKATAIASQVKDQTREDAQRQTQEFSQQVKQG